MNNEVYESVKDDFPAPAQSPDGGPIVDFRALALGRPPIAVATAMQRYARDWQEKGLRAWQHLDDTAEGEADFGWWQLAEVLGKHIEPLLKAPPGSCILMPNVTTVVHQLLSSPELNNQHKRKVIVTDREFPTIYDALHNMNRRFDGFPPGIKHAVQFQIEVVQMGDQPFDAAKVIEQIDDGAAVIFLPHVASLTGEKLRNEDIKAIVSKAREHGVIVVLDGSQAIGSTEIDVQDLDVDVYTGTLLKQGCGASGNAYVYLKPGMDINPTGGGWAGVAEPFHHDVTSPGDQRARHPSPLRRMFGSGTPAIAPMYHATEGLRIFERVGYERVVRDIREKAAWMIDALNSANLPLVSPKDPARASALIALTIKGAEGFRDQLSNDKGVEVVANGDLVRVAPHVYLSAEEIQQGTHALIDAYDARAA